jgi:PAS domain S-box-containing protein
MSAGSGTEAARLQDRLQALEAREWAMLAAALDCVIGMDARGRVVEWNPAAERTFGYAAADANGQELAELIIPPELRERHRAGLARYLATGEPRILGRRVEMWAVRQDGTRLPVELAVTRVGAAEPPHFVAWVRDIGDRKHRDAELARAREQLEIILHGVGEGVTALDTAGRLVYANSTAAELIGYGTVDELLAAPVAETLARFELLDEHGERVGYDVLPSRRALRGEHPPETEIGFRTLPDGETRYSLVRATPVFEVDGQVALVVNIFHDITERKREDEHQRFLVEANAELFASLDYRERLARLMALIVPRLADWASVDLLGDDGELHPVDVAHADPGRLAIARRLRAAYPRRRGESSAGEVLRTGRSQLHAVVRDEMLVAAARDDVELQLLRALGLRSAIVVPLVARGQPLGLITLASARSARRYTWTDVRRAEELARQAAMAIDNSLLYEERRQTAERLQATLLPRALPAIPGVDIAAMHRSAGEGTDVGGDFYDLFQVGPDSWLLAIGDVCGQGIEAAALAGLTRHTLRGAALHQPSPARALLDVREAIRDELPHDRFLTVACLRLDLPRGGRGAAATVASAGHPLPVLRRADRSTARIGGPGTLLAAHVDPLVTEETCALRAGDSVVLFTDGITEARDRDGRLFGEPALMDCIAGASGTPVEIIEHVGAAVREHQERARDDQALVALTLRPSG